MLRLATDADVHGGLVRGLRRRSAGIDLVRARDALPEGVSDREVLAWAAEEGRVLITNDRNTMVGFAYERAVAGEPMPGVIVTTNEQSIGSAIDDIFLVAECMPAAETKGSVSHRGDAGKAGGKKRGNESELGLAFRGKLELKAS